jgi:acyl-CoA synthetase (AMP-forming)/AMP-acid ligase II
MYSGILGILMAPMSFLKRPLKWLKAISNADIKGKITSGAPNFAYELCLDRISEDQISELDLSKWKVAYSGAEPVRAATLEKFAERFAVAGFRKESFFPVYGLAEATLIASAGEIEALPHVYDFDSKSIEQNKVAQAISNENAYTLVGCGQNFEGQEIVIVNPDTLKESSADEVGEIWMAGPSIAKGYWNNPLETAKTFHAYIAESKRGPFLRTGDLGFLKENQLYITGRLKDLIIIRGVNHYPQDIECTVEEANEVLRPGCGAAFSIDKDGEERLVILQEVRRQYAKRFDPETVFADILKAVSQNHSLQPYAIVLIEPSSFPKTSSGKLQRRASKNMFLSNALQVLSEWRSGGILEEKENLNRILTTI